jgi:tRNA modification GTPase
VVLAGPVNSGKSTLFNALVGNQRALVSSAAGTTRDLLCESVRLGDWPILLFDTAGERALDPRGLAQSVEAQGQELGRHARRSADVVLWLEPADSEPLPAPAGALRLLTRADLVSGRGDRAGVAGAVAAGPDPLGAARTLQRVLSQALELPERAHEPGAGVPFEAWMQPLLDRALGHDDSAPLDELRRER